MDLEELKLILQKEKTRIVIVENGKPIMVVLPYESINKENTAHGADEIAEPLDNYQEEEMGLDHGELTIDDLPI